MKRAFCPLASLLLSFFSFAASTPAAAASLPPPTTRQQTIRPIAIPPGTPPVAPRDVANYGIYATWQLGPGEDAGRRFDLMPASYKGSSHAARLLTFFSMSDVHITDKESPAQVPFFGWNAPFGSSGLLSQAYSPVMLSTTQVLDAAVRTVNALHRQTPFDFGIFLGDVANSNQYNELRWFIDVLDGKFITPSSGAHAGAGSIGYQQPFQAAGLDRTIPWYEVIGNHDEFWMGVAFPSTKLQNTLVGGTILNMSPNLFAPNATEGNGVYVGVIDGTTRFGEVIKGGATANFATPPTIIADANRRLLSNADSFTANIVGEFFNTTSLPVGHGFTRNGTGSTAACYTFEPKSNLPLKVIVLDDTCKTYNPAGGPAYYGGGWIDAARLAWLTGELQKGQDAGQLMIIAAHIPIKPQKDLFDTTSSPQFQPDSAQSDTELIATLNKYPNLLMLMAGHRHINAVTPQPSPDPAHPEYGFWEVETASLRDFPRQFRTIELRRNADNTISILATNVDPQVEAGTPAADSLGYAIGAGRVFGNIALNDATSHAYNVELIKPLSPAMQAKIASYGTPLSQIAFAPSSLENTIYNFAPATASGAAAPVTGILTATGLGFAISASGFPLYSGAPFSWTKTGPNTGTLVESDGVRTWTSTLTFTSATTATVQRTYSDGTAAVSGTLTLAPIPQPAATAPLVNYSTRATLPAGGSITAGFVVGGNAPRKLLIRGIGPTMASFGVPNAMANPTLTLYSGNSVLATNDDHGGGIDITAVTAAVHAFPLPTASRDAALVQTLNPGIYTATVKGATATDSGEVLAEVYFVE
ncbi:MAG: TIGR03768 family metallophosphoesterase [Opitutae bacterium]|nr:TIGR03768 family metallophosphoesterase [Opitutae bacterium]